MLTHGFHFYNIDKSVLVENRPLVKFIRNYIRDSRGEFSISSLVKISMTSFTAFTLLFVKKYSCLYHKKKIKRQLEDINLILLNSILLTRCACP